MGKINLKPDNILKPRSGRLLLSDPFLMDSSFSRMVILLCEHDDEGTFGLVLNNYMEIEPGSQNKSLKANLNRLSVGGPVETFQVHYLHSLGHKVDGSVHIANNIYFGGNFKQLQEVVEAPEYNGREVRFFLGYSGWAAGQLEEEILQKSWYVAEFSKDLKILDTRLNNLWAEAIKSMGGDFVNLANFPRDPQFN